MPAIYSSRKIVLPEEILERANNGLEQLDDKNLRWRYHKVKPIITYRNNIRIANKLNTKDMSCSCLIKGIHMEDLRSPFLSVVLDDYGFSFEQLTEFDNIEPVEKREKVDEFLCLTKFRSRDCFFISMASVLTQMPKELLLASDAFEVVEYPEATGNLTVYPEITMKGYHLSRVKTYKLPKDYNRRN